MMCDLQPCVWRMLLCADDLTALAQYAWQVHPINMHAHATLFLYRLLSMMRRLCLQVLPLDEYVFNTEAHPLPLPGSRHGESLRSTFAHGPGSGLSLSQHVHRPTLQAALTFYQHQLHGTSGTARSPPVAYERAPDLHAAAAAMT